MSDMKSRYTRDGTRSSYFQHDDRGDQRIVSFQPGGGGRNNRRRHMKRVNGRSTFDDEGDVQMGSMEEDNNSRKTRFVPYEARGFAKGKGRRHNQRRRGGNGNNRDGGFNQRNDRPSRTNNNWFRIVMPEVSHISKEFILRKITERCDVPFVPYEYHVDGKGYAIFYVEGKNCSTALERVSNIIQLPNGLRLKIRAYPSQPPDSMLNTSVLDKIKLVMSKRYDTNTNSLDLSAFLQDIDFKNEGIYAALNRSNVFSNVIRLIEENIPNALLKLNLSDNKLTQEQLRFMSGKLKTLKSLLLAGNYFRGLSDLNPIKDLPLEELVLSRTPLRDNYNDQATYISDVRQRFPKVVRLDGQELPPTYGFDVEPEIVLPPSQGNYFSNESVRGIVPQFLEQYFTFYDSGDRQKLLAAYHDQALFSMSAVAFLKSGNNAGNSNAINQFKAYYEESRNLLKINVGRRQKLLHEGKINIISFLCSLPKSQHDPMSFSIDAPHFSNSLLTVSCSGVFKEVDAKPSTAIRAFSRVFMLVPQGAGFCIINEMLFVTNATADQAKVAFKVPAPTPSPSPVPPAAMVNALTPEQQQQMVITFSQQSGMNREWSAKCLQENDWDFEKSAFVFQEYNKNGQIPAEAFVQL